MDTVKAAANHTLIKNSIIIDCTPTSASVELLRSLHHSCWLWSLDLLMNGRLINQNYDFEAFIKL